MQLNTVVAQIIALTLVAVPMCAQLSERQVAITIDDLPAMSAAAMSATEITDMTRMLVAKLRAERVPAVAFVNEGRLYKTGQTDERIQALATWIEGGFELGNHTFSHASLNQQSLREWEEDVIRGETVTKMLLQQHNMKLRYLRHPFLDTGRDLMTRRKAEEFDARLLSATNLSRFFCFTLVGLRPNT